VFKFATDSRIVRWISETAGGLHGSLLPQKQATPKHQDYYSQNMRAIHYLRLDDAVSTLISNPQLSKSVA
jgi:hypothetical protein